MREFACATLVVALFGCAEAPPTTRDDPAFERFRADVVPILERRCAIGCHGVPAERWSPDGDEHGGLQFPIAREDGRIPAGALHLVYDRARDTKHRLEPGTNADFSPILRHPTADEYGGLSHSGWDVFATPEDPDYRTLRRWVELEVGRLPADAPPPPAEAFFRDRVLGVMVRNGCFLQSCHGPGAFSDLKLMPPLPRADAAHDPAAGFSPRMVHHNRMQMLGKKTRFANLGGDLLLSRLLVKNLPIEAGGVHQRGGNGQFFEDADDPDVRTLIEWMKLERAALTARLTSGGAPVGAPGVLRGVLFVRRPSAARRRFFEVDPFQPTAELWIAPAGDGPPFPLSRGLFDAPIDIQGADVRYDGRAVVFSVRASSEAGFRIYELELDANLRARPGSLRRLTDGPARTEDGTLVHHVDPLYTPGPKDKDALDDVAVAFASNAAGDWAPAAPYALLGEADGGDLDTVVDAQRTEAPGTLTGLRLSFVDGPLAGTWRHILRHEADPASVVGARLVLDRALPEAPDRRSVYTIETADPLWTSSYDIWRVLPGRPGGARQMTFTSAQDRHPTMRATGEVMFTSVRNVGYQAGRPVYNGAIFRVMAGGFDYHIQGGNRSRHPLYVDSRELPQGLEIRLVTDPLGWWGAGALMLVDHGFGVNIEPDNPVDRVPLGPDAPFGSASTRFLPAQLPLFPETGHHAVTSAGRSPGGSFRDPYPLPDGRILVAHTSQAVDHLDPSRPPEWDLYALEFPGSLQRPDGTGVGPVELHRLSGSTRGASETHPRPIMVRLKEKQHPPQKFAWRADGKKPERVDGVLRMPANAPAVIECYDYPLLESFLTDFAPVGPRRFRDDDDLPPHERVAGIRVLAQQPPHRADVRRVDTADPFATARGLGVHAPSTIVAEVPLEPDGSFQVQVPTEVPLRVQGTNADGMAIHSMNRWFYLQPGEKLTFSIPRSVFPLRCAGCHGALTGDRTDALGPPDGVTSASRVMATWNPETHRRRPPHRPRPRAIDFRRDVQPILDRACVRCHDERTPPDLRGAPTAHFTVAYESLHALADPDSGDFANKRYIAEREASSAASYLFEKLTGRELLAPAVLDTPGAPHPKAPLSDADLRTLVRWVDLGATFVGATGPAAIERER